MSKRITNVRVPVAGSEENIDQLRAASEDLKFAAFGRMSREAQRAGLYDRFFSMMRGSGAHFAHDYSFLCSVYLDQGQSVQEAIESGYQTLKVLPEFDYGISANG